MSETITLESIFALFKETRDLFEETDRRMQQSRENFDRQMKESRENFDRRMQETDRKMQETDRKIKEVSQLVGNLGNRLGDFVEHMVAPGVLRMFQARGIEVHQIFPNAQATRNGEEIEIDILAVNGVELVAVECKSRVGREDIDRHLARLPKIKRLFPQWANHRIYGAVASMLWDNEVADFAEEVGLFVIGQNGETVEIRNRQEFQPKAY